MKVVMGSPTLNPNMLSEATVVIPDPPLANFSPVNAPPECVWVNVAGVSPRLFGKASPTVQPDHAGSRLTFNAMYALVSVS